MAKKRKKRPAAHTHYIKRGGKYVGHTRTESLSQIHARYYYKKHGRGK